VLLFLCSTEEWERYVRESTPTFKFFPGESDSLPDSSPSPPLEADKSLLPDFSEASPEAVEAFKRFYIVRDLFQLLGLLFDQLQKKGQPIPKIGKNVIDSTIRNCLPWTTLPKTLPSVCKLDPTLIPATLCLLLGDKPEVPKWRLRLLCFQRPMVILDKETCNLEVREALRGYISRHTDNKQASETLVRAVSNFAAPPLVEPAVADRPNISRRPGPRAVSFWGRSRTVNTTAGAPEAPRSRTDLRRILGLWFGHASPLDRFAQFIERPAPSGNDDHTGDPSNAVAAPDAASGIPHAGQLSPTIFTSGPVVVVQTPPSADVAAPHVTVHVEDGSLLAHAHAASSSMTPASAA